MQEVVPGFVPIKDVQRLFNTSRKSVERRRDKARQVGDSRTYRQFRLRTKDGKLHEEPTLEVVKSLRANGKVPEWFVSRAWLAAEFGKRNQDGGESNAQQSSAASAPNDIRQLMEELRASYEGRIADLKEELAAARKREEQALEYAERDKERFATAASNLTSVVMRLPEVAEATPDAQNPIVVQAKDKSTSDSTDANSVAKPKGRGLGRWLRWPRR